MTLNAYPTLAQRQPIRRGLLIFPLPKLDNNAQRHLLVSLQPRHCRMGEKEEETPCIPARLAKFSESREKLSENRPMKGSAAA
jgi:hypothetical protein